MLRGMTGDRGEHKTPITRHATGSNIAGQVPVELPMRYEGAGCTYCSSVIVLIAITATCVSLNSHFERGNSFCREFAIGL